MDENSRYKKIKCIPCGKDYLSNYYYTHKKQMCHQKKCVSMELKEQLLKDKIQMEEDKQNIKEIIKSKIDIINNNIKEIYKLMEKDF
jgi:hypothetical protein